MFNRMKFNHSFFNRVRIIIIPLAPNPPIILDNMNLSYSEYLTLLQEINLEMVKLHYSEYTIIVSFGIESEPILSDVDFVLSLSYIEETFNLTHNEHVVVLSYVELED